MTATKIWGIFLALILIFYAPVTQAGFFSFIEKIFGGTEEPSPIFLTAQNMPLLTSIKNPDPEAGLGGGDITVVGGNALLPATGPLGSIADVEIEDKKQYRISIYVIREGDTLSGIAKMFGVTANTLVWANDLRRGHIIQAGQTLVILPVSGVQHAIAKGDTVAKLAAKYKADEGEVLNYNNLTPGEPLVIGETIIIPDGEIYIPPAQTRIVRGGGPEYAGYYRRPIEGGRKSQGLHGYNGVDLASFCGASVVAAASGDVIIARPYGWNGGYGQYAVLTHPNGTQTLYGHLSGITVGPGWHVAQGQVIGYVGSTGKSTGCHLHFEVRGATNPF